GSSVVSFPTGTPVRQEARGSWDPKWNPAARQALLKNGYEPIPLNGKRPVLDAWQNSHPTLNDITIWETAFPGAGNTGVLTRFVPAVDDDVLDPEVADIIHGWVRELIPPGCPELLRFGRFPKRAISVATRHSPRFRLANGSIKRASSINWKFWVAANKLHVM